MISRHQDNLNAQALKYLNTVGQLKNVPYLNALASGSCFGLSICQGIMRKKGKLIWWEAVKDVLLSWDGELDSLQDKFILTGSLEKEAVTRQSLFEKFIHYLVMSQSDLFPHIELDQNKLLDQDGWFEYLDEKGEILKIKKNYCISGYFSTENLIILLSDKITQQLIEVELCLIHNFDHTCELSYKDGVWRVYDPNEMYQEFTTTSIRKLALAINAGLGFSLSFEVACFQLTTMQPFPYFQYLLYNQSFELMKEDALRIIVADSPTQLPIIFKQLNLPENQFLKQKINLEISEKDGNTPLMLAFYRGDKACISLLCEQGAKVNVMNSIGKTPLNMAITTLHDLDLVKQLCQYGAIPALPYRYNKFYINALMAAIIHNEVDIALYFLKNHCFELNNFFPVSLEKLFKNLAEDNAKKFCKHLLIYPPSKDYQANEFINFTALHWAVFKGRKEIVREILKLAKFPSQIISELKSMALAFNHTEIHTLLLKQTIIFGFFNSLSKRKIENLNHSEFPLQKRPRTFG